MKPEHVELLRAQLLRTRAGQRMAEGGTFDAAFAEHIAQMPVIRLTWQDTERIARHASAGNARTPCSLVPPAEHGLPPHTPASISRWRVRIHNGRPHGRGPAFISDDRPRVPFEDDLIE